jgi:hypothetical protein
MDFLGIIDALSAVQDCLVTGEEEQIGRAITLLGVYIIPTLTAQHEAEDAGETRVMLEKIQRAEKRAARTKAKAETPRVPFALSLLSALRPLPA